MKLNFIKDNLKTIFKINFMLQAPLEQFQILQLVPITVFSLDFSITNFLLINLLGLASFLSFIYYTTSQSALHHLYR